MPIVVEPQEYVGRQLYLRPTPGWGWRGADDETPTDFASIGAAGGFWVRVVWFFRERGELRGVVGRVEQSGHLLDGLWVVGGTMLRGEWDFTERVCWRYDLEFGTQEPGDGEWPRLSRGRRYGGYGIFAEAAGDTMALRREA